MCEKAADDYKVPYHNQACATGTVKVPLRHQLEIERTRLNERIKWSKEELNRVESSLKLLDKNKDLETLVNLLNR